MNCFALCVLGVLLSGIVFVFIALFVLVHVVVMCCDVVVLLRVAVESFSLQFWEHARWPSASREDVMVRSSSE